MCVRHCLRTCVSLGYYSWKDNTCNMVQRRRRAVSPSPHWCVMCKDGYDYVKHLFFQCAVALLNGFTEFTLVEEILWVYWPCCVIDTSLLEVEKRD